MELTKVKKAIERALKEVAKRQIIEDKGKKELIHQKWKKMPMEAKGRGSSN